MERGCWSGGDGGVDMFAVVYVVSIYILYIYINPALYGGLKGGNLLERWKCAARLDCHQASVRLLGCMYVVLVCAPYVLMFALILCISRDVFLGADKGYYAYCPSISQP